MTFHNWGVTGIPTLTVHEFGYEEYPTFSIGYGDDDGDRDVHIMIPILVPHLPSYPFESYHDPHLNY